MINLINSILPTLCLCIGFFIGYNMKANQSIKIPEQIKHPNKYIKKKMQDKKEQKEVQEEINYLNDVLYNIENYDGTGIGQRTVRRGENN